MTFEEATAETKKIFGEDSFAEQDETPHNTRYYVGACPKSPGIYQAYMGFSWEDALNHARKAT